MTNRSSEGADKVSRELTVEYLSAALAKIELREGAYSRDQLTHAENTIEAMAKVAHDALNGEWEPGSVGE